MREAPLLAAEVSGPIVCLRRPRAGIFQYIQTAVDTIRDVDQVVFVHVNVVDLNRRLAGRRWRNEKTALLGLKWIADVDNANPGIEVAKIDQQIVVLRARAIFMNIVR